jgi:hypothetical protein
MNEIIIIFLGIFILIIFIILFVLLYYVNDNYISYNNEVTDNLYKSEQIINDTSTAFNKLQDNVINKIANVNSNQDVIINKNINSADKISSNLINVIDIINNNIKLNNLTSNMIDNNKSLNINIKPDITTYKNISALTNGSNLINICNNEIDPTKRKCLNINVDDSGGFNIYTANKFNSNSNIANISIRDTSNNVMAQFDGANKTILLGSNISPAISIQNNTYTPDIIVCNYKYFTDSENIANNYININFVSNFNIKSSSILNFIIPDNYIATITASTTSTEYTNASYNNNILQLKNINQIQKNTIKDWNIQITYKVPVVIDTTRKFNTNGYITLS